MTDRIDAPHSLDEELAWDSGLRFAFTPDTEAGSAGPRSGTGGRLGRYRIEERIAQGGMGVVHRAIDTDLDREVAVKRLREGGARSAEAAARFFAEARVAGRLQHPGVCPVYDFGLDAEGRPFIVLKLLKGETLAEILADREGPGTRRAALVAILERAAQAVAHAHAHGVVHRDLKPANVMVGAFGEVAVLDWGLARDEIVPFDSVGAVPDDREAIAAPAAARGAEEASSGEVVGTPGYMAPEQARGTAAVDPRSDVFALGAILCEILTGKPPWGDRKERALSRARRADVAPVHGLLAVHADDSELEDLARRCLDPDPAGRPADGGEVAGALAAWRENASARVEAARLEVAEARGRATSERRTRRIVVALAAVAVVALIGGAWLYLDARLERERAVQTVHAALADSASWLEAEALDAADAALRTARAGLEGLSGEAPELSRRAAELAESLETARGVRETRAALRELRLHPTEEDAEALAGFARLFQDHGLDPAVPRAEDLAGGVAARPEVAVEAALALDDWALRLHRTRGAAALARVAGLLETAARLDPQPVRARLRRAAASGDPQALERARMGLEEDALAPESLLVLATVLVLDGRGAEARAGLEAATRRHPADFWLHWAVVQLAEESEGTSEALRHALAAQSLRPGSPPVRRRLARAFEHAGELDRAREHLEEALRLAPEDVRVRERLAELWLEEGRIEEALEALGDGGSRGVRPVRRRVGEVIDALIAAVERRGAALGGRNSRPRGLVDERPRRVGPGSGRRPGRVRPRPEGPRRGGGPQGTAPGRGPGGGRHVPPEPGPRSEPRTLGPDFERRVLHLARDGFEAAEYERVARLAALAARNGSRRLGIFRVLALLESGRFAEAETALAEIGDAAPRALREEIAALPKMRAAAEAYIERGAVPPPAQRVRVARTLRRMDAHWEAAELLHRELDALLERDGIDRHRERRHAAATFLRAGVSSRAEAAPETARSFLEAALALARREMEELRAAAGRRLGRIELGRRVGAWLQDVRLEPARGLQPDEALSPDLSTAFDEVFGAFESLAPPPQRPGRSGR